MSPYKIPAALWLASATGLVVMLLGDGVWDVLGLVCLASPALAVVRVARRDQSR